VQAKPARRQRREPSLSRAAVGVSTVSTSLKWRSGARVWAAVSETAVRIGGGREQALVAGDTAKHKTYDAEIGQQQLERRPSRRGGRAPVLLPGDGSARRSGGDHDRQERRQDRRRSRLLADSGATIELRQSKYLNNVVEQDHRAVKRRVRTMMGFKTFGTARSLIAGIETMHMIKKGNCDARVGLHSRLRTTSTAWPRDPSATSDDALPTACAYFDTSNVTHEQVVVRLGFLIRRCSDRGRLWACRRRA
jgi:hypothetical protein